MKQIYNLKMIIRQCNMDIICIFLKICIQTKFLSFFLLLHCFLAEKTVGNNHSNYIKFFIT